VVRNLTQAFTKLEFSLTLPIGQPVYLGTGLAIVKETIGGRACDAAVTGFGFSFFGSEQVQVQNIGNTFGSIHR
jgi:hypothetical protein